MALLRALSGEPADAARLLEAYLATRRARATPDSEWLPEMVQAAMTAVLLGHRAAAAPIYSAIAPYAGLFAVEGILARAPGAASTPTWDGWPVCWTAPTTPNGTFAAALERDAAAGSALAERTRRWAAGTPAVSRAGMLPRRAPSGATARCGRCPTPGGRCCCATARACATSPRCWPAPAVTSRSTSSPARPAASGTRGSSWPTAPRSTAYRRRLVELEDERADAEAMHDPARAERAATERDALVDELAAVTGLGGRARRAGSDAERMRKAIGNRIRQAHGPYRGTCIRSWAGTCGCPCGPARSAATTPTARCAGGCARGLAARPGSRYAGCGAVIGASRGATAV